MDEHSTTIKADPFATLGLNQSASETEIRERYLDLVKQHPPETDSTRFRQIHDAYESAKDPLILAERLLSPSRQMPEWDDVIEQQEKRPPALNASLLIALGNRPEVKSASTTERIDTAHD